MLPYTELNNDRLTRFMEIFEEYERVFSDDDLHEVLSFTAAQDTADFSTNKSTIESYYTTLITTSINLFVNYTMAVQANGIEDTDIQKLTAAHLMEKDLINIRKQKEEQQHKVYEKPIPQEETALATLMEFLNEQGLTSVTFESAESLASLYKAEAERKKYQMFGMNQERDAANAEVDSIRDTMSEHIREFGKPYRLSMFIFEQFVLPRYLASTETTMKHTGVGVIDTAEREIIATRTVLEDLRAEKQRQLVEETSIDLQRVYTETEIRENPELLYDALGPLWTEGLVKQHLRIDSIELTRRMTEHELLTTHIPEVEILFTTNQFKQEDDGSWQSFCPVFQTYCSNMNLLKIILMVDL